MTLQTSGAITFSDLMTEFNSPGGASNIKLGDYHSRYPDAHGSPISLTTYVTWDGYQLKFGGLGAATDSSYSVYSGKMRLRLLLDSTVTRPVYVATTKNNSGSDLCSSGVANNGSAYNASSTYHQGSYTIIQIDVTTAAGGVANDLSKKVYINTDIQQTLGSGGADVSIFFASFDDSGYVTYNRPFVDLEFAATLDCSGESQQALFWGQPYVINYTSSGTPGILKDGDSMKWSMTVDALPNPNTSGTLCYPYLGFFYPVTWTGTGLAQGYSNGSSGYLGWDTYGGSGTNYIGGSGAQPNTGTGVANVCRNGPANPTLLSGSLSGVSGFTGTWGGSDAQLEYTLANNTGNDYKITTWTNTDGNQNAFMFQYFDPSSSSVLTTNDSGYSSSFNGSTHYGQSYYPRFRFARKNNANVALADLDIAFYSADGSTMAPDNRAAVVSMIKDYINTAGGGTPSRSYPGTQLGSSTGVSWYSYDASEPTTGTVRLRWASGIGGTFEAGINPVFVEVDVLPGYVPFTANGNVTATYSTGTYDLTDNAAVLIQKRNMSMTKYYGTRNLGTDGG